MADTTVAPGRRAADFPAHSRFAPSYRVSSKAGLDRVLIHDAEFVDELEPDNAARIALDRRIETEIAGLFWDQKVVVIPPTGIPCVHGQVGPFTVLFIQGPSFDAVKAEERQLLARVAGYRIPAGKLDAKIEEA